MNLCSRPERIGIEKGEIMRFLIKTRNRFLQAGIYNGMNGTGGLKGWPWLIIFDGIISLPIAVLGFWLIPDSPANMRAFYLKSDDREVAQKRMEKVGRAKAGGLSWKKIKGVLTH